MSVWGWILVVVGVGIVVRNWWGKNGWKYPLVSDALCNVGNRTRARVDGLVSRILEKL